MLDLSTLDFNAIAVGLTAMCCIGGVAYVFLYPYLSGDKRADERQKALTNQGPKVIANERVSRGDRREQVAQSLKELEIKEQKKTKVPLEMRIAQAGLEMSNSKFYVICVVTGVFVMFMAFAITLSPYVAAFGLFAGAFGLPMWILSYLRNKRVAKFINEFPNAMDVIVRGVKSGLPLGDCLRIIANESAEPVRTEFKYIVDVQTMGIPLTEAVTKLYERIPVSEANFFGIVIAIQSKAGGSLSEALGNLSRVLRERKKMAGKISAMSMEAKASAAIIASLPVVVMTLLYVSSPGYISLLWTTDVGKMSMAASSFWMFVGVMAMKKMISFDL
jgi:tight adherence protein B